MRNGADIQYRANLMFVFENDCKRIENGTHTGRETHNGLKMALAFLNSLSSEYLTDREFRHALRLSTYRGTITDHTKLYTA